MASHAKQNGDNRSFMNIVSDIAFGPRGSKLDDDGKPSLDEVLTELEVSERESDDLYMPAVNAVEPARPQAQPQPAVTAAKIAAPAASEEAKAPVAGTAPAPAPAAPAAPSADLAEAQRRADGHRQRLEKLLGEARQIEEMLAKEAAEARALADKVNLEEKRTAAAHAAELERQAIALANDVAARRETAVAQHAQSAAEVRALREAVDAAVESVKEIETRFAEAQKLVTQTKFKLRESETKAEQATTLADNAKIEARNAERKAAKCREAREAAEAELHKAEEIASSIALTAATLERMRSLGTDLPK